MIRIVVDFPAPLGPRNPVTRPGWAVKVTSSTAVKCPYFLVSPSTVIMAALLSGSGACQYGGRADRRPWCCASSSSDLVALDVDVRQQAVEPARQPPVAVAEQLHRGRHQDHPDDGGVDEDGGCQSDAEHLAEDVLAEHEGEEHGDHHGGAGGDDPGGLGEPVGDGERVVAGLVVLLLDPRQQEHLVVHREPEQDREDPDRAAGSGPVWPPGCRPGPRAVLR